MQKITKTSYVAETPDGVKLSATLHLPGTQNCAVAFVLHGFSSSQNSSTNKALIPLLMARNVIAVTFDFRGCGSSTGDLGLTTVTSGVTDLETVINGARERNYIPKTKELVFIGSSFGGTVAIAATKRFLPKGLLLKSPMIDIPEAQMRMRGSAAMRDWERQRFLRMERKSGVVDLSFEYIRDAQQYNLFDPAYCSASGRSVIVHGNRDEIAPFEFSRSFVDVCPGARQLYEVDGAGHEYNEPAQFARMINLLERGMDTIFD